MRLRCARLGARGGLLALGLALAPAATAQEAHVHAPRVAELAPDPLRAWESPGSLPERAERARLAALQVGAHGFDAPARAILLDPSGGSRLERARNAVAVAPGLPLARASLARALLGEFDLRGAIAAAWQALRTLPAHPEARLWLEASATLALRDALFLGGLLFLALVALRHGRSAAHDLGDRFVRVLPLFARAALLGVAVLVPAMLGQGLLGLALALLLLAFSRGDRPERRAALAAALLLLVGLELGTRLPAVALVAFEPDAVAASAFLVEQGSAGGPDLAVLERAQADDPLAARALAIAARRAGRLQEAAARYDGLLASAQGDAVAANNAGNVWMALGDAERAVALYEVADSLRGNPVTLYNLSFGYGEAIRPSLQDETLQRLQMRDPELSHTLMELQEKLVGGFTLDLPLPAATYRQRALEGDAVEATAAELRRPLAPGALGRAPLFAAGALAAAALLGHLAARYRPSGGCLHCGARLCPRCDAPPPARGLCAACHRVLRRPETTDPALRARRMEELARRARRLARGRLVASVLLPGAAGVFGGRPALGLAGAVSGVAALRFGWAPGGLVADPLAAGGAGSLALGLAAAVCTGVYGVVVWWALRTGAPEAEA